MTVVFVGYLVIGIAMPVLPLHVHDGLGLGAFVVGLVAGSQFIASLLSRMWAGHYADSRGTKRSVLAGLVIASISGGLYLVSLQVHVPNASAATLLAGRAMLGVAESFIITGALSYGMSLMGPGHSGTVMSWVGTSLYAAFALGAPVGTFLYGRYGFEAIALATTLLPVLTLLIAGTLRALPHATHTRPAFGGIVATVWKPGVGLALSGVGFGAITTFVALLFIERGWEPAWVAFTALSLAFIAGRMFFGHLPDRMGGARVAFVCMLIEAVGQALIWLAPSFSMALVGVILSGLGYALVYPALGVEALRNAPPESRGVVMGAYTAFLDLSLGLASPALGLIAASNGFSTVFLASTFAVLASAVVALWLKPRAMSLARATNINRSPLLSAGGR
jgi:MFS family permease